MRSAELFGGCGGLALGLARAGFEHAAFVELDGDAVATVEHNRNSGIEDLKDWIVLKRDVREVDWTAYQGKVELVSGGPPCQPFGIGGKKRGHEDHRDMWPEAVRAVHEAAPPAFLFENVRNLAGPKFASYLAWIIECLRRPALAERNDETHAEHMTRLQLTPTPAEYNLCWQVVNAADYGAPQIRHRVIIQGLAAGLGTSPKPLRPTHSLNRLLWDQWVTGEYWKRHGIRKSAEPPDRAHKSKVATLLELKSPPPGKPWVTIRDVIADLGEPNGRNHHTHQPGARTYKGHTGSSLDMPSKALKAGDHGVPGGENMLRHANGKVRYFTLREAARLVGLPDNYVFPRSWTESMRQLGNAVPAQLGEAAARHVRAQLEAAWAETRPVLAAAE